MNRNNKLRVLLREIEREGLSPAALDGGAWITEDTIEYWMDMIEGAIEATVEDTTDEC